MTQQLRTFLEKAGIILPLPTIQKCAEFCHVLLTENQKVNLISRTTTETELLLKHVVDSIMGFSFLKDHSFEKAIDIGSGGGIPGLILAILTPQTSWTLMDSTQKKMHACENIARTIGLTNVTCVTGRTEALGHVVRFREQYDLATVRGVAPLSVILEYCLPFVKRQGVVACYKGTAALTQTELSAAHNALHVLGGDQPTVHHYQLPENTGERTMVLVSKKHPTPRDYPRAIGTPSKKPL